MAEPLSDGELLPIALAMLGVSSCLAWAGYPAVLAIILPTGQKRVVRRADIYAYIAAEAPPDTAVAAPRKQRGKK